MEISVVKSTDLTAQDWTEITNGFNKAFDRLKTGQEFKLYYQNNQFGYAYHSVARNEAGTIIGHTSVIPQIYNVDNKEYQFGLSGGSYVLKEYRQDALLFKDIYEAIRNHCRTVNMSVIIGIPNHNSFKFFIKILESIYVKDLKYYMLPINLSAILHRKKYKFVDKLAWLPIRSLLFLHQIIAFFFNPKEKDYLIYQKMDDEFFRYRFNEKYQSIKDQKTNGIYRIVVEKGIKTAYIMEFRQQGKRTLKALIAVLKHILYNEKIDAILFIGELSFKQFILFKVPAKKIPQRFPLTYDLLVDENAAFAELLTSPENWDFGLMNFDVR